MTRSGKVTPLIGSILAIAAAVCLLPDTASAATFSTTYYLQSFNLNPDPNAAVANYAKITLTGDNTAGTVGFSITTNFAGSFDSTAKLNSIGFTFDSPELDGITTSNFTSLPTNYVANEGPSQLDGYGTFGWVVEASTPNASLRTTSFSFSITGLNSFLTAGAWALADVFDPNSQGRLFAAHYYPSNNGPTGWIDRASSTILVPPPPPPVPEPSALALAGIGIFSILGFGKFRGRKS